MRSTFLRLSFVSLLLWVAACGPTGEGLPAGQGGTTGAGGETPSSGGTVASGGTEASGGTIGQGGSLASGGTQASGGVTPSGGTTASGGSIDRGTGGRGTGGRGTGGTTVGQGGRSNPGTGGVSIGGRTTGGRTGAGGAPTGGTTTPSTSEACTPGTPLTGGTSHCSSSAQGTLSGGYSWSIWSSGSGGCIITYTQGCAFKATWNNSGDFLARAGLGWNSTQTYDQLGTITADYAYTKTGSGGGYSYIGIYGWSKDPLVEFYIVDDSFGRPNPGPKVGSITVDGAAYSVHKTTRTNAPCITGNSCTFDQFFSVRQTLRTCAHISITTHFDEWKKLGLNLGKMYEAKILVEAGGGSGSLDFTSASMTVVK
jgi:endo-1,4-beta-xylanase